MTALIRVRLTPRAGRSEISGWREGALLVRVTAPPVEGAANSALTKLLAKHLGVARGSLRVVAGVKAREKVVEVEGLTEREIRERIAVG